MRPCTQCRDLDGFENFRAKQQRFDRPDHRINRLQMSAAHDAAIHPNATARDAFDPSDMGHEVFGHGHFQHFQFRMRHFPTPKFAGIFCDYASLDCKPSKIHPSAPPPNRGLYAMICRLALAFRNSITHSVITTTTAPARTAASLQSSPRTETHPTYQQSPIRRLFSLPAGYGRPGGVASFVRPIRFSRVAIPPGRANSRAPMLALLFMRRA